MVKVSKHTSTEGRIWYNFGDPRLILFTDYFISRSYLIEDTMLAWLPIRITKKDPKQNITTEIDMALFSL